MQSCQPCPLVIVEFPVQTRTQYHHMMFLFFNVLFIYFVTFGHNFY